MTVTETTVRVAELREAYQREQAAENKRLRAENKRLRDELAYAETVAIPAVLAVTGTVVVPRRLLAPRGVTPGRVVAEQNAAGDVILRLERVE